MCTATIASTRLRQLTVPMALLRPTTMTLTMPMQASMATWLTANHSQRRRHRRLVAAAAAPMPKNLSIPLRRQQPAVRSIHHARQATSTGLQHHPLRRSRLHLCALQGASTPATPSCRRFLALLPRKTVSITLLLLLRHQCFVLTRIRYQSTDEQANKLPRHSLLVLLLLCGANSTLRSRRSSNTNPLSLSVELKELKVHCLANGRQNRRPSRSITPPG